MTKVKYTREQLFSMDAEEIYKLVLKGDSLKRFPNGFWKRPEAEQNSIKCIKFLIENILRWSNEEIKSNLTGQIFIDNGLSGMLNHVFSHSPYKAIDATYPNSFKEWEFKQVSKGFWTKEKAIKATKWLIEEKLKWSNEEIKANLTYRIFKDNGLSGMLNILFNNSPYQAIDLAYPNSFKEWEFGSVPMGFWTKERAIKATKWMIEDKLKWSDEDIKNNLTSQIFKENKLDGMLNALFNASPFEAINTTYPNRFKKWEFKQVSKGFWTKERAIKATKWLIEDKLKWTDEDIKSKVSAQTFKDNSLSGMLQHVFNFSPYEAINTTYPNRFKEWELSSVPKGFWTKEKGIEATKWLIEDVLKWSDEDIKSKLTQQTFIDNGLWGMLQDVFKGSPYLAINTTYPRKFKEWELPRVPQGFWTKEKGVEATRWLIEEKLQWSDDDIKDKLTVQTFKNNGLSGMLQHVFNFSSYQAIDSTYPNKFRKEELKGYNNTL